MRVSILIIALAAGLAISGCTRAQAPVVVELFTSEGCSSCPPADDFLFELRARDGVLALGYHVDYWNWLGWQDRFASPDFSARQRAYARRLGSQVYTPQLVVAGSYQAVGSDRPGVDDAIRRAARHAVPLVAITSSWMDGGSLEISLSPGSHEEPALVRLVRFLASASSEVGAGENAGRTLRHANIVETIETIGTWNGEAEVIVLPAERMEGAAGLTGYAIVVQMPQQGAIIGAHEVPVP